MNSWERKRILIWGKTRPELSRTHKETVCTGGVFEDTKQFVRLYPIPLRYLEDDAILKKYHWIVADVRKAVKDFRPESYNIRVDTIAIAEPIPSVKGDWSRRAEWILQPDHVFRSVEALHAARERSGTSIGLVKPLSITDYRVEMYSDEEQREFWAKYRSIMAQQEFGFDAGEDRTVRPLPPPECRFQIVFRCDDPSCTKEHVFSVFDWEVDALYNRLRSKGESSKQACEKVIDKLRDDVCADDRDTYFFLGNIAAHPHRFTIVGLWYPKKQEARQMDLFDKLATG